MNQALINLLIFFTLINYSELKSQDWFDYDQEEEFPFLAWEERKASFHPSFDEYDQKTCQDYERTKKEFGFKSYLFDTEQGDYLEDFRELIDSILLLLPKSCKYEIVSSFTDEIAKRWTVNVNVNNMSYKFSTQAIGGIFMDTENLYKNLNQIILKHAPGYEIIIPDLFYGQETEILIEKTKNVQNASKKGFPYPPFKIEWTIEIDKHWRLHCTDCIISNESELISNYIISFNELQKGSSFKKKLNPDNFHICDINGNGLLYICLNGKIIGTPSKYKNRIECYSSLPEFILGYTLGKLNGCSIYLANIDKKKRRLISMPELKEIIKKGM